MRFQILFPSHFESQGKMYVYITNKMFYKVRHGKVKNI